MLKKNIFFNFFFLKKKLFTVDIQNAIYSVFALKCN
jgi:hypothetical protein